MFAYIVRRLLWAVVLLIVLSMVTFSIFYLMPRLGGATPETLAARYVGRAATAETVHLTAQNGSGSSTRYPCSTGTGSRASLSVPATTMAPAWSIARHLVLDTPSSRSSPCGLSCSIAPP